jgi:hypothetical protein
MNGGSVIRWPPKGDLAYGAASLAFGKVKKGERPRVCSSQSGISDMESSVTEVMDVAAEMPFDEKDENVAVVELVEVRDTSEG